MKKIIIITIISSILSIIIYIYTKKDEINIVSLGDGISIGMTPYNIEGYSYNDYLKNDYLNTHKLNKYYEYGSFGKTVKELIYEIKANQPKRFNDKNIAIKEAINEADILTIAIGMDELAEDKITNIVMHEYLDDMHELFKIIANLNHNQVLILGLYTINKSELYTIEKINSHLKELSTTYHFNFLDIMNIINNEDYYLNPNSYYINYLGHKAIYNELKKTCKV